jgi:Tol biopolymer transport system component
LNDSGEEGNGSCDNSSLSSDGRYVVFQSRATNFIDSDTNDSSDVFVYDRETNRLTLMSKSAEGELGNSASFNAVVSTDGRYVEFTSHATNLVSGGSLAGSDIYVAPNE